MVKQMVRDRRMEKSNGYISYAVDPDELEYEMDTEDWAWDDVSGRRLNPEKVREARKEEIEEYHKHEVYVKVPIEECRKETGKAPIQVRWIDVNKGDTLNPEYRSRLVAK